MDGISFDSLTYLPDDSFVIECNDDFSGICEDIVRLASVTHLVDQLDPGNESPPSSCYYSSGRYFDKEIPSLFSEMEYLTEVSPETEMAIVPSNQTPLAVDPIEFSWKRKEDKMNEQSESKNEESHSSIEEMPKETNDVDNRYIGSTNYKKILQNYIQKGKRRLEESANAKMKATVVSVTAGTNSTSLIETVTCASYVGTQYSTGGSLREPGNQFVSEPAHLPNYRCHDCNSCFLSVERLKKHTCIIAEQYQCQLCRREFRKRKTLEQHIKSHDKVFSTDDDLRKW
ncbi:uncharacterized protein LOC129777446 [Toxorhynchites rutilus septentrionalis]|uniref:uncharacterized protein LOC129777446 n=1 Tax=Toxorhynchites rutilus septentrionalis TaxID=329112 RepID=UPI00247887D1|nr:uncharacterized protein LOC129777446 [Toxorhynchites rutilus septentrionalis]